MMAAQRRGQGLMKVELPEDGLTTLDLPPISALFLIYFDIKAGYTIGWKHSLPGIELDGIVEYKSLPSGLHTVKEDLIYYVNNGFAGLSAFVNAPKAEESRNARMIAVGILAPLSYGRLGRCWKHAGKLKEMAQLAFRNCYNTVLFLIRDIRELVHNPSDTGTLENYWETQKAQDDRQPVQSGSPIEMSSNSIIKSKKQCPRGAMEHSRNRSASDGTFLLQPGHSLSEYHPAWSLSALLSTFGPLIFPIYRAALLRKRILISGHTPVRETCDFVYDISVLSNIPLAITDLVSPSAPPQRLRPLFSIGVHDIPFLEDDLKASRARHMTPRLGINDDVEVEDAGRGWVACTTDDILAMKGAYYDVLITMPPLYSKDAKEKVWPKVESPRGSQIKATQRDLRRYRALVWGLSRIGAEPQGQSFKRSSAVDNTSNTPQQYSPSIALVHEGPLLDISDMDSIVEPLSWSALAYAGFMWWATAGEQRITVDDEGENDGALLEGLDITRRTPKSARSRSESNIPPMIHSPDLSAKKEMAIIAYFHRLTTLMLTTLSDIVDATDSDDEADGDDLPLQAEGEEVPTVFISGGDLVKMGLDEWSASDYVFVETFVMSYFGHRAQIDGRNIDICGIRIC